MAILTTNFPFGLSDEDLKKQIDDLLKDVFDSGIHTNKVLQLAPLISLGQTELQRRTVIALKEISEKEFKSSKRIALASFWISIVSVILLLLSIYLSSRSDDYFSASDANWKQEENNQAKSEFDLLGKINDQLWLLRHGK